MRVKCGVYVVFASFLAVYVALTLYRPGGLLAYIVPSLCWTAVALATLVLAGVERIRTWTNKRIVLMALLVAVFQVFILLDVGLINRFGKSPMSFTPAGIAVNLMLVSSSLLGAELSRGYLAKNLSRRRPVLTLSVITLLYTFTNVSVFSLLDFESPLIYSKFMGEVLLPTLASNLLATYLAILSGPVGSLAYRAPLQSFWWFSPILPDLPWGYKSLIGVMTPTVGFMVVNMATTQVDLVRAGIPVKREPVVKTRESQRSLRRWLAISVFLVLAVWMSTGLIGFQLNVIASGSMQPVLDVGDIAVTVQTSIEDIKVGDMIRYRRRGDPAPTIHRVVEISRRGSGVYIVTKGDANAVPDEPMTIPLTEKLGKVVFVVPKVGWASIYLKQAIGIAWRTVAENPAVGYTLLAAVPVAVALSAYRRRRRHRWRRWRW